MLFPTKTLRPSLPPRVVVTGAGIVSALGIGWRKNADGLRMGKSAFRPVTLFDVARHRVKVAAQAGLPQIFPPMGISDQKMQHLDRATQILLLAAHEAWTQSGWKASEDLPLVLGTTAGGMSMGEDYFRAAGQATRQCSRQRFRAVHYQSQRQGRSVADAFDFNGPILIVSNACASGASAIGMAWEQIRRGQSERVFAGGYDALSLLVFSGFDALQVLSPTVCRPFDAGRDGLGIGEGAAMLALETLESAKRRGAAILGELTGYGSAIDLHHLTQPQPQGDAALAAMNRACDAARVSPADIQYVNAHGTGTILNDGAEAMAIKRWAGGHAPSLPVSSTKACIGHLLGGAGAVEAVVCLMALCEQWLPPEFGFETPDPICNFPIVQKPTDAKLTSVLSNSFGFGGANATLIFRRWE